MQTIISFGSRRLSVGFKPANLLWLSVNFLSVSLRMRLKGHEPAQFPLIAPYFQFVLINLKVSCIALLQGDCVLVSNICCEVKDRSVNYFYFAKLLFLLMIFLSLCSCVICSNFSLLVIPFLIITCL